MGDTIEQRLILRVMAEGLRLLEERGGAERGELELISIHALGFPRERGGILYYAKSLGLATLLAQMEDASARYGTRFAPPGILIDLVRRGGTQFGVETRSAGQQRGGMLE